MHPYNRTPILCPCATPMGHAIWVPKPKRSHHSHVKAPNELLRPFSDARRPSDMYTAPKHRQMVLHDASFSS